MDIPYSKIEDVQLRNDIDLGRLINGKKGGMMYHGQFKNDEFGMYDAIFHVTSRILVTVRYDGGKAFVLNGKSDKATQELYAELKSKANL